MTTGDRLGTQIRAAQHALRAATDGALRSRGLTMSQHALLSAVGEGGAASNAELAGRAGVTPQSAHELLRILEERGLVERPGSVSRGRAGEIRLTRAGRRALASADARVAAIEARVTDRLGEAQTRRLRELLAAATDALGEDGSTRGSP
jgi:DNA-binding MarR family transcriptional regulator